MNVVREPRGAEVVAAPGGGRPCSQLTEGRFNSAEEPSNRRKGNLISALAPTPEGPLVLGWLALQTPACLNQPIGGLEGTGGGDGVLVSGPAHPWDTCPRPQPLDHRQPLDDEG